MSLEQDIEAIVRRVLREELAAFKAPAGLVTIVAYAEARSISPSTVRAAIKDGRLTATRIGRAVRLRADAEFTAIDNFTADRATTTARKLGLAVVK